MLLLELTCFCFALASLTVDKQTEIIQAFNQTTRYLNDLLKIDNLYFEGMVSRGCPPELQLGRSDVSDTKAQFRIYIVYLKRTLVCFLA